MKVDRFNDRILPSAQDCGYTKYRGGEEIMSTDMSTEHNCSACSTGCAARHTEENTVEEVSAGPYLVIAALAIILVSLALKWLF
jgi:phage-related protein